MRLRWRTAACSAIVAAAAVVTLPGAAVEAEEPTPTRDEVREAVRELAKPVGEVDSASAASPRGTDGGLSAAALPAGLCYGVTFGDANEGGDSLLDAASYGLGYECENSEWIFDVTTFDSWTAQNLDFLELAFDTTNNWDDGCFGVEYSASLFSDSLGLFGGLFRYNANCDATLISTIDGTKLAGNNVRMEFPGNVLRSVPTLRWQSAITHVSISDPIDLMPDGAGFRTSPGNPCGGRCFYLSNQTTGGPAEHFWVDRQPASQILYGDWNGDGIDSMGYRRMSSYALKNAHAATAPDYSFSYGRSTDVVLVGDWDGDGDDTLAVRRGNTYYLTNATTGGPADITVSYGRPSDVVLVGDWDGNGTDTLAVRRGSTYYLSNSFAGGPADITVAYGRPADIVLVGDWDGDGDATLAVRRNSTYYLKNSFTGGPADITFSYGAPSDITFAGDWDGINGDTLGVRR